jgi:hypothetical protein
MGALPAEQPYVTVGSSATKLAGQLPVAGDKMTKRGSLLTLLILLGFGVFLLWSTLTSQQAECTVTVAFGGVQGTGTASAASETDAVREAQTAACGPLAQGMNDAIACSRTPPVSRRCRTL